MAAKEAAATDHKESGGGGGGNKIVLILSALNSVVVIAMVAVLFISFQKEKKAASIADISTQEEAPAAAEKAGEHGGEHGGHGAAHGAASGAKKAAQFGKIITLDMFTINLSTPGGTAPRFVRVNISIEVPTDEVEAEITHKMPQVRNTIIDLFNSKRPTDLATPDGRDYVKDEIKNAVNGFLVTGKIKGVFFTNFAVTS